MTTWSVTASHRCQDTTPFAGLTTQRQLGALAAGSVARCGACAPILQVMGQAPATSFVAMLWFDVVRPTIRLFILDVSTVRSGSHPCNPQDISVRFAFCPLLMSLSQRPVCIPPRDLASVSPSLPHRSIISCFFLCLIHCSVCPVAQVTAESGFIFKEFPNMIEVIEPTTVVVNLNFPDVSSLNLYHPFSCFLF
ncbi:hypothetical protein Pelo_4871 [Pelomyxa schiedti]|nr:hypothetical protein Pelo_4871 [Pelomyxa schiedti]